MSIYKAEREKMNEIFKRSSLIANTKPKTRNEKNRKRNVIVNFRMSPEEKEILDERIKLSGLKKQDYFIQSCLYQSIITFGNIKTFDEIRFQIGLIVEHLYNIHYTDKLDITVLESLRTILEILDGLQLDDGF